MRRAPAHVVRGAIARHMLGARLQSQPLGDVLLYPHQAVGAERVRDMLARHGGALLADDVGLGKTYVALSVARDAGDTLVIAPAALRATWERASATAGVSVRFASVEQLSRANYASRHAGDGSSLVIIDEAHHLRSPGTRRFAAVANLCRSSRVLLLSATPVQNRVADLRTILSLFLGQRAFGHSEEELSRFIVRRGESDVDGAAAGLPAVREPRWLPSPEDADCLDRILALPPPLPPADGGDAGILIAYTLARQWASSRAALRAGLQRRLARALAMEDALSAGRMPSRRELEAWCYAEGVQQLGFPELMVVGASPSPEPMLAQVRAHADAVRDLLAWIAANPDPDLERAAALGAVLENHPGERVVAFSEHAETVAMLYRALAVRGRVAMITHGGGRIASGPITRRELLDRFARGRPTSEDSRDAIDLLLTTDVLSEGVNLQHASVVAHLDLSWNPARLEQRVGRLRRIGAARPEVSVYVCAPPPSADHLLHMEERLRAKLLRAARTVGHGATVLPLHAGPARADAFATREERIDRLLRAWRPLATTLVNSNHAESAPRGAGIWCAVRARSAGALACVRVAGAPQLVAVHGGSVTTSREAVERMLDDAGGDAVEAGVAAMQQAAARVRRWATRRGIASVLDMPSLRVARSRRLLLRRVESVARALPRHAQPRLAPLLQAIRAGAAVTLPAGSERRLDELARAPLRDDEWLRAVAEFAATHGRAPRDDEPEVLAILLLCPDETLLAENGL